MSVTIDWQCIENFIGYGRLDAPIIFVGMEEGLASEDALQDDLVLRSRFTPVMDLEMAHRGIADGERLFSDTPRRQPTWRVMADVMLHYEDAHFEDSVQRSRARRLYRTKRLGRLDGDSLLTELLPYPNKKTSAWLYDSLTEYATREEYAAALLPRRLQMLRLALAAHPRKAIICYGRSDWENFKKLFPDVAWTATDRFECARWNGAAVTLTDHFATKYFNTDEDLDQLARVVLRFACP